MYLLSVALVVLSGLLVQGGTTHCLHGPSFWCVSKENAGKCGMTDYCIENVWNSNVPAIVGGNEDITTTCDLCHNIYEQLHLFREAGGDINILEMLDRSLCPGEDTECLQKTNTIFERIEEFADAKDAETACTLFELCAPKMYLEVKQFANLVSGFQCSSCQFIISQLKTSISEISEADLEKMMEEACNMWELDSDCDSMAEKYAKDVQTFLETLDQGELCTDMGMCNNDFVSIEHFKEEVKEIISSMEGADKDDSNNINACSVCKIAISVAEMQLKVINLTLSTGNYIFSELCGMFSNDYCYKIQQLIMSVQNKLSTMIDPNSICEMLNICSSSNQIASTELEPSLEVKHLQNFVKKFIKSFM